MCFRITWDAGDDNGTASIGCKSNCEPWDMDSMPIRYLNSVIEVYKTFDVDTTYSIEWVDNKAHPNSTSIYLEICDIKELMNSRLGYLDMVDLI